MVRLGVGESGWYRRSLRFGVGSVSDDESSELESGGARGDGCVRNCRMGGSDAGLCLAFLAGRLDERMPEREAVMWPRAVAGV